MILMRLIIVCQSVFTITCLIIQMYAVCSSKWAIFESRVELGLVEEHGHYGLWAICTKKFIPAQVTEDGQVITDITDCEPMNTFYKPNHNRALISFLAIVHFLVMLCYLSLVTLRLVELYLYKPNKFISDTDTDLEESQTSKVKQYLIAIGQWIFNITGQPSHEHTKKLIRIKLCTISLAAIATALAVWESISLNRPLRDTDIFQISNVSSKNYRTFRGPGFFAQLISLVIDMFLTSLIAIEVRVLMVLQQLEEEEDATNGETTTKSYGTRDNIESGDDFIINPFSPTDNLSKSSRFDFTDKNCETPAIPMNETTSPNNSLYVNSIEIRKLKNAKLKITKGETLHKAGHSKDVSYINPSFVDENQSVC